MWRGNPREIKLFLSGDREKSVSTASFVSQPRSLIFSLQLKLGMKQTLITLNDQRLNNSFKYSPWPAAEGRSGRRVGALVSPGAKSA